MINLLRVLRRGSIEKQVVRSCLFSCLKGRDLHELMLRNSDVLATEDGEHEGEGNEHDGIQTVNGVAVGNSGEQGRTEAGRNHGSNEGGNGNAPSGEVSVIGRNTRSNHNLSGGFQRLQKQSRTDWMTMVATGTM